MQALLKSAWLVRQARGVRHGLDWRPRASRWRPCSTTSATVEFWQPAVIRQRKLAALTFGYQYAGQPDFGLQSLHDRAGRSPAIRSTMSRARDSTYPTCPSCTIWTWTGAMPWSCRPPAGTKLRPEDDCAGVPPPARRRLRPEAAGGQRTGSRARLSAGRRHGRRRGLAAHEPHGRCPPLGRIPASWWPGQRPDALVRALGRPTIGIYRASTPVRTPLVGSNYTASLGDRGASPSREAVMASVEQALAAK